MVLTSLKTGHASVVQYSRLNFSSKPELYYYWAIANFLFVPLGFRRKRVDRDY